VTVLWNSEAFAAGERHDALRETIRERVVRVELDLPRAPERVQARVALSGIGRVQLCSVDAMPTTVTRTLRHAQMDDDEPALFLTLQMTGTSAMVQHGRHATLHAGQFAVYATNSPYTLLFEKGVHSHFFRFPLRDLALPQMLIDDMSARSMGSDGDVVGALASEYLSRLVADPQLRQGTAGERLASPTIELVRAALTRSARDSTIARDAAESSLTVRLLEYMRAHLGDAALSAATIAAAHYISVRHLYTVLSRAGISLGDWIRAERLERCRSDLARQGLRHKTIAAVAADWGFADATHFARVFREAYGFSPREWRVLKLCQPTIDPSEGPLD
jgi:AraC-like DNA-binding protein